MLIGVPIAISLGLAGSLTIMIFSQDSVRSLAIKLFETSEHYTLLAIPFFLLAGAFSPLAVHAAGNLMNTLGNYQHDADFYIGLYWTPRVDMEWREVQIAYASGGAGYALTRAMLAKLAPLRLCRPRYFCVAGARYATPFASSSSWRLSRLYPGKLSCRNFRNSPSSYSESPPPAPAG